MSPSRCRMGTVHSTLELLSVTPAATLGVAAYSSALVRERESLRWDSHHSRVTARAPCARFQRHLTSDPNCRSVCDIHPEDLSITLLRALARATQIALTCTEPCVDILWSAYSPKFCALTRNMEPFDTQPFQKPLSSLWWPTSICSAASFFGHLVHGLSHRAGLFFIASFLHEILLSCFSLSHFFACPLHSLQRPPPTSDIVAVCCSVLQCAWLYSPPCLHLISRVSFSHAQAI